MQVLDFRSSTDSSTDERGRDVESASEELWVLWERVGAQGLDTWYPLPSWCVAPDSSRANETERSSTHRDYGCSALLKSYLADLEDSAEGNEYTTWLRQMFNRLEGGARNRRAPVP